MKKLILLILLFPSLAFGNLVTIGESNWVTSNTVNFGVGDLLSERWDSDTGWTDYTEGTGATVDKDSTLTSGDTGFVGEHLRVYGSSESWAANTYKDLSTASQTEVYARFYFHVNSSNWDTNMSETIFTITNSTDGSGTCNNGCVRLSYDTGDLVLRFTPNNDETPATGSHTSSAISVGTSYKIEVKMVEGGATDVAEWKVNGTVIGTWSEAIWSALDMDRLYVGQSFTIQTNDASTDTIDIDSTGYLVDE